MPVEGSTSLFLGNYDLSSKIYRKFWSAMSPPKKQVLFSMNESDPLLHPDGTVSEGHQLNFAS